MHFRFYSYCDSWSILISNSWLFESFSSLDCVKVISSSKYAILIICLFSRKGKLIYPKYDCCTQALWSLTQKYFLFYFLSAFLILFLILIDCVLHYKVYANLIHSANLHLLDETCNQLYLYIFKTNNDKVWSCCHLLHYFADLYTLFAFLCREYR